MCKSKVREISVSPRRAVVSSSKGFHDRQNTVEYEIDGAMAAMKGRCLVYKQTSV